MSELEKAVPVHWQNHRLDMSRALTAVEGLLPSMLRDKKPWRTYMVDHAWPYLMRAFRPISLKDGRKVYANIHYFFSPKDEILDIISRYKNAAMDISTVTSERALYHPHSEAIGIRIHDGSYRQLVGYSDTYGLDILPPQCEDIIQSSGNNSRYSFNDPLIWHAVIPLNNQSVTTLMISHRPSGWGQPGIRPAHRPRALKMEEQSFLFGKFKELYPLPNPSYARPANPALL